MGDMPSIIADQVTKQFRLRPTRGRTLKATVLEKLRPRRYASAFAALTDVSFSVPHGETLGIIGANGAGKSTLLSLVAGTMVPTRGAIRTEGTVSSLLELGAGFHPDLTGRENVFLYGAIMGISQDRMKKRFDAVVDFAGIGDYIDQPVRHYSSGMYVRLGFAVAVEVDPDVLLIDEVLAVGDAEFQRKCLDKMSDFRRRGKTMLIVSHDLATIQSISDRILFLDGGRVVGLGTPQSVIDAYRSRSGRSGTAGMGREWGTGEMRITGARILDASGNEPAAFQWGGGLQAVVDDQAMRRIEDPVFGFAISDKNGTLIFGSNTQIEGFRIPFIDGKGSMRLVIDKLPMASGTYLFSFSCHSSDHRANYHRLDHFFPFHVESQKPFEGPCYMACRWNQEQ
jgi:ABC-type polysaccharide/polyol phosphate transport system ATPase subunit